VLSARDMAEDTTIIMGEDSTMEDTTMEDTTMVDII